jgi:hypothetical protein
MVGITISQLDEPTLERLRLRATEQGRTATKNDRLSHKLVFGRSQDRLHRDDKRRSSIPQIGH